MMTMTWYFASDFFCGTFDFCWRTFRGHNNVCCSSPPPYKIMLSNNCFFSVYPVILENYCKQIICGNCTNSQMHISYNHRRNVFFELLKVSFGSLQHSCSCSSFYLNFFWLRKTNFLWWELHQMTMTHTYRHLFIKIKTK